jgi:AcrR family transcriptional regulator
MFDQPLNPYKPAEYFEARRLRVEEGMPMKQIAARLGVSVGSVHLWTKDIEISLEQAERNQHRGRAKAAKTWKAKNRARRLAFQEEGRKRARLGDPLHQAGCFLYWAEGSKERNVVGFANSDVHMVRFFVRFLRESLEVRADQIKVNLNVYTGNGLSIEEIEEYWLDALDLDRSCLRAHMVNHFPTSSSGKKRNRLPYGVCFVKVHSTRLVQHIYGAIQEYGGFEEPRWLDCDRNSAEAGTG